MAKTLEDLSKEVPGAGEKIYNEIVKERFNYYDFYQNLYSWQFDEVDVYDDKEVGKWWQSKWDDEEDLNMTLEEIAKKYRAEANELYYVEIDITHAGKSYIGIVSNCKTWC